MDSEPELELRDGKWQYINAGPDGPQGPPVYEPERYECLDKQLEEAYGEKKIWTGSDSVSTKQELLEYTFQILTECNNTIEHDTSMTIEDYQLVFSDMQNILVKASNYLQRQLKIKEECKSAK